MELTMSAMSEAQHTHLSSQMILAKQRKAKAEGERQVRFNRIARLQADEMKLMKRIEETHRRTKDVLNQKAEKEQVALERERVERERSAELSEQRQRLLESKVQQKASIQVGAGAREGPPPRAGSAHSLDARATRIPRRTQSKQEACWMSRHHTVQSVKVQRESIASESEARRQSELRKKSQLRADIRRMDEERRERRRLAQEALEQQLKDGQEGRLTAEEAKIREQEAKLAALERREHALLRSLKSYQGEQREALHELEAYLSGSPGSRRQRGGAPLLLLEAKGAAAGEAQSPAGEPPDGGAEPRVPGAPAGAVAAAPAAAT